nr:LamG domain-containing protein [Sphingomonadales bacterium]
MNYSFSKIWSLSVAFMVMLIVSPCKGQSLNGLSMDGIDDYVAVSGSSALVANLGSFSMACWVYPTNAAPSYPDFDGIMGFRNDVNADFYVLQLSATTYEARFRNSAGTIHTLTQGPVLLNQWQHLALVYTDSSLRFYHNGNLAGSMNATGMITNTNIPLEIGRLSFSSNPFYLNGNIDEAALWGRALSDNEVMCLYKQQLDSASAALLSYYPMDQGIAGGNNVSVPYLEDIKGGYHGFFYGLNLTGSNSNFVTGRQMMGILRDTLCRGESLVYGGTTYQQAGQFRVR